MKLTYDPRYNIAYILLAEELSEVESVSISDDVNVDLTPESKVYGIELLNANEQIKALVGGRLTVENEATGASVEVGMP
jgi:uncharacterized protein YuzE